MVEQNAAASENAIAFAVIDRHPMRIQLGHAVGATWVERRIFNLWNGLHLAKHFRCTGLIKLDLWVHQTNRLQQVQSTDTGDLCRGSGLVKTHTDEALCR